VCRERLFFWLLLAASANNVIGPAIRSVLQHGAAYSAFNLFGLSAIVWVGFIAGLAILAKHKGGVATRLDYAVAGLAALMIMLPMATASAVAVTLLAVYGIATSAAGSDLRRASIIFLSISVSLFWGRLFLALFSRSLLHVDAFFVTNMFGAKQDGNQVYFIDQSQGAFIVAPGCSSLQGMSLAFVFWATLTQWCRVPFSFKSALWCAAAVVATLVINVLRLGALAHFPAHFDAIHTGWGWHVASWTTLAAIVAIVVYGARREIFEPR
jgi:exosortase/archaeosortase family protein